MAPSNWIDKAIAYVAPVAAARRFQARSALELGSRLLTRHYEGSAHGRRTDNWRAPGTSANAAALPSLHTLRWRSRDLARNNPWASSAINLIDDDVVGTGIRCKLVRARGDIAPAIEDLWTAWAESTDCDAAGVHDLYGLQGLVMRTIAESGSALVRRRRRRPSDNLPVPLQLQVLEPDHLDSSRDRILGSGQGRIIGGIEFDALDRRVAYWLFPNHPGESILPLQSLASVRVTADNVRHVYRVERPGQIVGIPWLASCILRLRDFDEYEDAHLVRQKIAACFAVFVRDSEYPDQAIPGASGKPPELDVNGQPKPEIGPLFPGMIEYLGPGKTVEMASPPGVENYAEYTAGILRAIAAGAGVPYEGLSGNYNGMPFSAARLSYLRYGKRIDKWRWRILIPGFCNPTASWFLEALELDSGLDTTGVAPRWTAPRRDVIDPVQETNATKTRVRAGLCSLSEAIRESGDDPDDVFEEIQSDQELIDQLGIVVECDARRPALGTGNAGDAPLTGEAPPEAPPGGALADAGTSGGTD